MPLPIGAPAPDFTLYDDARQPWSLADHRGRKVVLLFFPGAFTSVCTTELNDVSNGFDRYREAGVEVVGISTDSVPVLMEFAKVNGFAFPLLSDHDADVARAYDAKYDRDFTDLKLDRIARRAAFLVDAEGIVRYAEVLASAGDQPDFDAIQTEIDVLT